MFRCVFVPKNEAGILDCETMEFESNNVDFFDIEDGEFTELSMAGVFDAINEKCDLAIEDYEEEIIENKNIEKAISTIKSNGLIDHSKSFSFIKSLETANMYKTKAYICF